MTEKHAPDSKRLLELLDVVTDDSYVLGPQDREDLTFLLGIAIDEARDYEQMVNAKKAAPASPTSPR